jgi:hypothetical protein
MEGFSQITSGHHFLSYKSYEKEKDHCTAGKNQNYAVTPSLKTATIKNEVFY